MPLVVIQHKSTCQPAHVSVDVLPQELDGTTPTNCFWIYKLGLSIVSIVLYFSFSTIQLTDLSFVVLF
jgi:hypothetical protein